MKDLTIEIEEKAKRYDEALERARVINKGTEDYNIVFAIFPELKESEEERIKTNIIKLLRFVRDTHHQYSDECNEAIDWLKKQGENKPAESSKFKAGDIITHNKANIIYKVVSVYSTGSYHVENIETGGEIALSYAEQNYHLWTIQDAKDGDVLVTRLSPEGDWVGIYKQSTETNRFKTYCFCNSVGEFVINPNRCKNHGTYGLHPATKEQRDLLFSKMKEAGYEWDAEKKELKKIELKSAWSEEDEMMLDRLLKHFDWVKGCYFSKNDCEEAQDWLKSIKGRMIWKPTEEQMS